MTVSMMVHDFESTILVVAALGQQSFQKLTRSIAAVATMSLASYDAESNRMTIPF